MSESASDASGLSAYLEILRRRRWLVATIAPLVLFIALLLAFGLQPKYRSTATIILEPSSIQANLIQTTVTTYADQQIEIVQGKVLTSESLARLVADRDPYPNRPDWSPERKARQLLSDITLERVDAVTLKRLDKSNAFSLHYLNPDPAIAAETVKRLSTLFLTYHQRTRANAAGEATLFLADRAKAVTEELQGLDSQYAQLRTRRGAASPDSADRTLESLDRAQRDLWNTQSELRVAEERESLLAIQLQGLSPNLMSSRGDMTDLATVRAQLAEAEQKYTDDHPDVKRLRRAVQSLLARGDVNRNSVVKADNPEYLRVSSQLTAARREIAALQASASGARSHVAQYSGYVQAAPVAEREFGEISRRRNVLQEQFQEIQTKLREAQLGQLFEAEQRGERFTLIREPAQAKNPAYPNQLGTILLGLVLGLALCAAAVAIAENLDPSVRDIDDLQFGHGIQLLGSVPPIFLPAEKRRAHRSRTYLVGTYAAGLLVIVYLVLT
jgi:polysaccharide biosynthesis transport protein